MTSEAFQRVAKHVWAKIIVSLMLGFFLSFLAFSFIIDVELGSLSAFARGGLATFCSVRFLVLFIFFSALSYPTLFHFSRFIGLLFRYRWLLACIVLVLCVIFQLSGSSLGIMLQYFGADDDTLAGIARAIRSDEWAVNTPMALSQAASDTPFSYFDDNFRGNLTDMFIVYGQPSWDIASIFRPFHWGYLLLGSEYGLSFFWCGRLVFLFMISLEFGLRILVKGSRPLAVGYALFVAFAGVVQWWFAVNGLVEMLIFGQLAIIWGQAYLRSSSYPKRVLYAFGIVWCLGVFILVFYPAWQIAIGYVFLALLVHLLVSELPRSRKGLRDIVIILGALALLALALAYVFTKSWDTVDAVMNTAYPGKRAVSGGGAELFPFYYPLMLIASVTPFDGVCEYATFFTGFPLCVLLPIYLMLRKQRPSSLMISLLAVSLFLYAYMAFGLPEFLSKITLLSHSMGSRVSTGCGFAMMMLTFVSLSRVDRSDAKGLITISLISLVVEFVSFAWYDIDLRMSQYLVMGAGILGFFVCAALVWMRYGRRVFCGMCLCVSMATGMLVNPVVTGEVSKLEHNESLAAIRDQYEEGDLWATVDLGFWYSNALASQGMDTLTSTNVYPQLEVWRVLDSDGSDESIYNRYAHIKISLKDEGEPEFNLESVDAMVVTCTPEDLASLGVTNIVSSNTDLEELFDGDDVHLRKTADLPNGLSVYELTPID